MKKLFLTLAAVAVLSLVGCSKGAPEPTGDVEKDAKAYTEYAVEIMKKANTKEDLEKLNKESEPIEKAFKEFYEKKGEADKKKYEEALQKEMQKPEVMAVFLEKVSIMMGGDQEEKK